MESQPPSSDLFALSLTGADKGPSRTEQAPPLAELGTGFPPRGQFPQFQDFVILRELGQGAFARVYLAHQTRFERRVALKVSAFPSRGEGQILARLEHDHIVKVYSDFLDPATGHNGLVLQYVPGTNLAQVLEFLFPRAASGSSRPPHSGQDILRAIDALSQEGVDFNPAALRDRELFEQGDYVATVCRLGARLAEALAFAHGQGILHCDIKPANILLNPYGRPLLVDFNIAVPSREEGAAVRGGTFLYMAPEQMAVFVLPGDKTLPPVDRRVDLYSLGLALLEAIAGSLPPLPQLSNGEPDRPAALEKKRQPDAWLAPIRPRVPDLVWRVLRRCLEPDMSRRYADGVQLAGALRRAADLHDGQQASSSVGRLGQAVRRWPLLSLILLTLLPHLIGSGVNIAYNAAQIPLNVAQQTAFMQLILIYNAIAYPLCFVLFMTVFWPLITAPHPETWSQLPTLALDRFRARVLSLGNWILALALIGWIPGGIFFPFTLNLLAGPVPWKVFGHFILSFTLSGLIALVYSYLGVQYVVLRALYPRLTHGDQTPADTEREHHSLVGQLGGIQVLAAFVPLAGALLLVALAPAEFTLVFRLLVTALIGAGLLGLGAAVSAVGYLRKLALLLTGSAEAGKK